MIVLISYIFIFSIYLHIQIFSELTLFSPEIHTKQTQYSFFLSGVKFLTLEKLKLVTFDLINFPLAKKASVTAIVTEKCSQNYRFAYTTGIYNFTTDGIGHIILPNIKSPCVGTTIFDHNLSFGVFFDIIQEEHHINNTLVSSDYITQNTTLTNQQKMAEMVHFASSIDDFFINRFSSQSSTLLSIPSSSSLPSSSSSSLLSLSRPFHSSFSIPSQTPQQQNQQILPTARIIASVQVDFASSPTHVTTPTTSTQSKTLPLSIPSIVPTPLTSVPSLFLSDSTQDHQNQNHAILSLSSTSNIYDTTDILQSTSSTSLNKTIYRQLFENMAVVTTNMFFFPQTTAFFFQGVPSVVFDTLHISWEAAPTPISFNTPVTTCCFVDSNFIWGGNDRRFCSKVDITSNSGTSSILPLADRTELIIPMGYYENFTTFLPTFEISCQVIPQFVKSNVNNVTNSLLQSLVIVQPYYKGKPLPYIQTKLFEHDKDIFLRQMWLVITTFFSVGLIIYFFICILGCYTFIKSRQLNLSFKL